MSIKFERVKVGDTLYDCHKTRAGNTTMRVMGTWPVRVFEVDRDKQQALVSWNNNRQEWWPRRRIERLRRSRPVDA